MRSRRWRLRRGVAASGAVLLSAGVALTAGVPAQAAAACTVVYKVQSQWTGGFTGDIAITNAGDPVTSWRLEYDFPDANQKVTQGWNATYAQSARHVTVTNASYNGTLATNQTVGTGFNGGWTSANPVPTSFTLNGTPCNGA